MRTGRLLLRGVAQAEIARRVGVSRTTVSVWNEQLEAAGLEALRRRARRRPCAIDAQQKAKLVKFSSRARSPRASPRSCGRCDESGS